MTPYVIVPAVLALGLLAPHAYAGDKAACLDAADEGQTLRNAHKLVEAREKLRVCAAAGCPTVVQGDCAEWLASVEKAMASLVVTAKDGAGASLVDVTVTVDGKPFASRLAGEAVSIDPGQHTFHFVGPGGTTLDQIVVAAEGEQNQRVVVVLDKKLSAPEAKNAPSQNPRSSASSAVAASPAGSGESGNAPPEAGTSGGGPWKTIGWVAGGAGVVGLGVGTIFGLMAISDHNAADCNAASVCLTGPLNDARGAATESSVGFIAGGVLLAAGVGLVLFAPAGGEQRASTAIAVTPVLARGGAGLGLGGTFR
jgi:hypothetical protein